MTFIWVLNGLILSVAKCQNESDAWELLETDNKNVYRILTGKEIIRPLTLELGSVISSEI